MDGSLRSAIHGRQWRYTHGQKVVPEAFVRLASSPPPRLHVTALSFDSHLPPTERVAAAECGNSSGRSTLRPYVGQEAARQEARANSGAQLLITSLRPVGGPVGVMVHHVIPTAPFLTR